MLLDRLLRPRSSLYYNAGSFSPGNAACADLILGPATAAGVRVDADKAMTLSAVFAAVTLLARVMSAMPIQVFAREGTNKTPAIDDPAYPLLTSSPNPEMTNFRARQCMHIWKILHGNAYAEIQRDGGGRPRRYWPIHPKRVRPMRLEDGTLVYRVDDTRNVDSADMLHFPHISLDGITGVGVIYFAGESIGSHLAAQEYAARYFGSGTKTGGILKNPLAITKAARDELKQSWNADHQGAQKAHKVSELWSGWDYTPDPNNAQESQLLETRRFAAEEVSRWTGIPCHLLSELSRATFSNIESQGLSFQIFCLQPMAVDHEQELDRKLLNPPKTYCKHDMSELLRADSAARAAFYAKLNALGVLTINDILGKEDMNGIGPDGDTRFIPVNMQTLERAIEGPPPPVAPMAPAEPDDDEVDPQQAPEPPS